MQQSNRKHRERITMIEVPDELMVEILLLLPVVALLRFRCVSKKWRDLIDSPDFVKSHLNLTNRRKAHSMMIFCEKSHLCYVDFDSVCNNNASPPPILKELKKPWHGDAYNFFGAVGVCNGLLCIHTSDFGVFVWNPSTRNHVQVPISQEVDRIVPWSWGFGYDIDSDDYKVVYISLSRVPNDGSARTVVWVYSLKSGLWKCIGDFPRAFLGSQQQGSRYLGLIRQRGVFVGGALHWRLRPHSERDCANLIVALDLGNLEFYLVPHPDFRYEDMCLNLGVLDGCLSAISYNYGVHGFDLWVMKEYGVKESWTRLVRCTGYTSRLTPLAYTEKGNELLFVTDSNEIVWYEFETRSFKRMTHCWLPELGRPLVYIPSLVCPQIGVCY